MHQHARTINTAGFLRFIDNFFDNLVTDWSIPSKISTWMNQISRVQNDVANTMGELERKLALTVQKEQALIEEKRAAMKAGNPALFFQN